MPRWFAAATIVVGAAAVCAVGIHWGTFSAADSDPYGYVSQADLMAHGSLHIDQRFARAMPWPDAEKTFVPPGYHPTPDGFIVPAYSPGLPLLMAAFERVKDRDAVFYVVPLLGALTILMTGWLGARLHDPVTGVLAALVVGTSVIFTYQLVQPVSDVAATAWWTASLALAVLAGPFSALLAGLAASMAVLTRPNLAPLAGVIALFSALHRDRLGHREYRRAVLFAFGTVPGCVAVAILNDRLFGSPLVSGYGTLSSLYAWSNLLTNLHHYPRWMIESQAWFLFIALGAPWWSHGMRRDRAWLLIAFSAAVFLAYLFYSAWGLHEWGYLRFVLPAFPALSVLAVVVVRELIERRAAAHGRIRTRLAILIVGAVAVWQAHEVKALGVPYAHVAEHRYVDVGEYAAKALPPNAIFLTGTQTGSLRYYSNKLTLRLEMLDGLWLDRAVDALRDRGYHPYIVLEDAEEDGWFRPRFAQNALGRLDWPAMVERSEPTTVRIYDPLDRDRFLRGAPIATWDLHLTRKPKITVRPDPTGAATP